MGENQEYHFIYSDGYIYMGVISAVILGWFILLGILEYLLHPVIYGWPRYIIPTLDLAGMALGYMIVRTKLRHLYIRRGVGVLFDNHFELTMGRKNHTIPYNAVKKLMYRNDKRYRGVIINAKRNILYVEEARGKRMESDDIEPDSLKLFYQALEPVIRPGKQEEE